MDTRICEIIAAGPGTSDVFLNGKVAFVPQDDPPALALLIEQVWNCDELRLGTAETGYRHSVSRRGGPELYQGILDNVAEWHRGS